MRDLTRRIIFIVAVAIFVVSCVRIYYVYSGYEKGKNEYKEIAEYVKPVSNEVEVPEEEEVVLTYEEEMAKFEIPMLDIDYEGLESINEDFVGWIYIPQLDINYPIVQGEDDSFYLHHTFEGQKNSSGCIFATAGSAKDFSSYNTFLYGHNMKNGTMFGSLKRLVKEEGLYEQIPCFYIYSKDCSYKYRIYSYYIAKPVSNTFAITDTKELYQMYIDNEISRSLVDYGVSVTPDTPSVTLSTCYGFGSGKKRLVVHGVREAAVEVR